MKRIKYERPRSLDAGQVAAIQGAVCSPLGSDAVDGCTQGNDPNLGPICSPTGSTATYNCGAGGTNLSGNCTTGSTAFGCGAGQTPNPDCTTGSAVY
jgi:hypothetical protein